MRRLLGHHHKGAIILCVATFAIAGALRVPRLDERPMHADEAILADKFGTLLETGSWKYDPRDFHGPVLPYVSLIPAQVAAVRRYADLTEVTLRVVPAAFGLLLVLVPLLLARGLGRAQAIAAAVLTAISPAMTYYSRYYIPEMLLTCLSAGLLVLAYRYKREQNMKLALFAGLLSGLMFATKETAIIAAGSMLLAAAATARKRPNWRQLLAAIGVAGVVIAALIGIPDTLQAFGSYFGRGFSEQKHVHPWHYYLGLLFSCEGLILALAVAGAAAAITGRGLAAADRQFIQFVGVYTIATAVVYSLIPYKTPWCLLGFLHGMILLASVGIVALAQMRSRVIRTLGLALVAGFGAHLVYQAFQASYVYASDPRNRYAYAHTTRDVYAIRERIERLAHAHPAGRNLVVQVVSRENLWPLPWYLRSSPQVEWWRGVTEEMRPASVIIASPNMEPALVHRLYEVPPPGERPLYVNMFHRDLELRPGMELRGYVKQSLWEAYVRTGRVED